MAVKNDLLEEQIKDGRLEAAEMRLLLYAAGYTLNGLGK
jgi:hypothetical protein